MFWITPIIHSDFLSKHPRLEDFDDESAIVQGPAVLKLFFEFSKEKGREGWSRGVMEVVKKGKGVHDFG